MSHIVSWARRRTARRWPLWAARAGAAAGLAIDAYVHWTWPAVYAEVRGRSARARCSGSRRWWRPSRRRPSLRRPPGRLPGRACGRGQRAGRAAGVAVRGPRAIGPFPDLYDPVWFPEKLLAAFAEGAAFVAAIGGSHHHRPGRLRPPTKAETGATAGTRQTGGISQHDKPVHPPPPRTWEPACAAGAPAVRPGSPGGRPRRRRDGRAGGPLQQRERFRVGREASTGSGGRYATGGDAGDARSLTRPVSRRRHGADRPVREGRFTPPSRKRRAHQVHRKLPELLVPGNRGPGCRAPCRQRRYRHPRLG